MAEASVLKKWPSRLGCPLVDGYGIQVVDRRISTDMDVGGTRRVEFDTDECIANCSLFLDGFRAGIFEAFERDVLHQGSLWFLALLWIGGKLEEHTVRFRERPQSGNKSGDYTEYSFTLDVKQRENLPPAWLVELFLEIDPEVLLMLYSRLHYILHVEWPGITNTPADLWA